MGYYIFSCGINTAEILSVFGCKDTKVQDKVKASGIFKNYSDFLPEGYKTTPAKALDDIINSNEYDYNSSFAYGYALISICMALGKKVPYNQEIKLGFETDYINKALKEDFGINLEIEEILLPDNTTFPIPPVKDWPLIGVISNNKLQILQEIFSKINITDERIEELTEGETEEEEEKGYAYEHIRGIMENINFCLENNLDLVSFCH